MALTKVTSGALADSINTEITANTAKVTNATHTGDVTGATALTIATDAVDIAMLSATGTADATTFLRGDNTWAEAGGGKVLQVVHVQDNGTGTSTTNTSWTNTDTTAQITCSATDSKVLVMFAGTGYGYRNNDGNQYFPKYQLYETATTTAFPGGSQDRFIRGTGFQPTAGSSNRIAGACVGTALHSPSSTSQLTYTVQIKNEYNSVSWNETQYETATITLMEIGA